MHALQIADPRVTVVVVPRERFALVPQTLERIYAHTDIPCELVCLDGGSPGRIRRYLEGQARVRGFRLVRTDHFLSPNQARNLGLREVCTPYVVFIDNDVVVEPGWRARCRSRKSALTARC
jgi:glycosyltransferase involved in cell wall biosynthesis